MKKLTTPWSRAVHHALIDRDMTVSGLAKELGVSRTYLASVISCRVFAPALIDRISNHMGLSVPYSVPDIISTPDPSTCFVDGQPCSTEASLPSGELTNGLRFASNDGDTVEPSMIIYSDDSHLLEEPW